MSDPADLWLIDGHADTPQRFLDEGWDFTNPPGTGHLSLGTAWTGGMGAEFFALWAEPKQWKGRYAERTLALIEAVQQQVRRHPDALRLCLSAEDIVAARSEGRFGVLMGVEGGHSIENNLNLLRRYYALGVRYMTLTWSNTNEWADSSGEEPVHRGLTSFGCDVIYEMNRLGMMVDVSHVSDETLGDVLEVCRAPIIASHSSARALTESPRNLSDISLREIAFNGGIIMVNFFPAFIDEAWRTAWNKQKWARGAAHAALEAKYQGKGPIPFHVSNAMDRQFAAHLPRAPLASLIDHIDHIARVAGIDHVGIGTDFDGIPSLPEGIDSAADLPKIAAGLRERGWPDAHLRKLYNENFLRVFTAVAAEAARQNRA